METDLFVFILDDLIVDKGGKFCNIVEDYRNLLCIDSIKKYSERATCYL